jgi:hypothetical protein
LSTAGYGPSRKGGPLLTNRGAYEVRALLCQPPYLDFLQPKRAPIITPCNNYSETPRLIVVIACRPHIPRPTQRGPRPLRAKVDGPDK